MIKILFVLEHFHPYVGGAETLFLSLTRSLVQAGHEVTVLTTQHSAELDTEEDLDGVKIYRINCSNRFAFVYAAVPKAKELAKQADIIHTSSYTAGIPAYLAARRARKPLSISFHEYWGKLWFRLPYLSVLQRILYYSFEQVVVSLPYDRIVTVSDFSKGRIEKRRPKVDITRIYNGIDYDEWNGSWVPPNEGFNALFLGRLGVSKGIDFLLAAADNFLAQSKDSTITMIIPDYPRRLSQRINRKIEDLQYRSRIKLIASLPFEELKREMCRASCIVIPSYSEGFGFVGVEAAAMGIPLISSQQGALKETISGQYIPMEKLDARSLSKAMSEAKDQRWKSTEKRLFPLKETVDQYIRLFIEITEEGMD